MRLLAPATPLKRALPSVERPGGRSFLTQWLPLGLVCLAAVAGPVCLGCTGAWGRLGLEAVLVIVAMCVAITGRLAVGPTWVTLAVCGLLSLQVLPLSDRTLVAIAPLSAGAWKTATDGAPAFHGSVAVDPGATLVGCRRMLVGLAGIIAVSQLTRGMAARRAILWALAVSGLVVLGLGVLFPVNPQDKVLLGFVDLKGPLEFWRSPVPAPAQTAGWAYLDWVAVGNSRYLTDLALVGDGFGSYISSNEFAAGVYLTFPAVLAALTMATRDRLPALARNIGLGMLVLGALVVVGGMAKSRAGCASLAFGSMVFFTLTTERPTARKAWMVATAVAAVGLLAFILLFHGHLDFLAGWWPSEWRGRLAAMSSDGRAIASHVAMRMFFASPILGTGLDTYGGVYPRMLGGNHVWYFAHNDYAQLLAETGLVGLGLLVGTATLAFASCRRFLCLHQPGDRIDGAFAWAGLASLAIHSAFDWNLHVPANAFIACALAGVAIASSLSDGPNASHFFSAPTGTLKSRVPGFVLAGACMIALTFLGRDATTELVATNLRRAMAAGKVSAQAADRPSARSQLLAAVEAGERATARDPANAQLAMLLGQASLHLAAHPETVAPQREAFASAASGWFRTATRRCATLRGLPEPIQEPRNSTP